MLYRLLKRSHVCIHALKRRRPDHLSSHAICSLFLESRKSKSVSPEYIIYGVDSVIVVCRCIQQVSTRHERVNREYMQDLYVTISKHLVVLPTGILTQ